jgi:hypothetical protein
MKLLIKLVLAGLIANATWRVATAYIQHYKFKDAVTEAALFGSKRSDVGLQQRVIDLAAQYEVPLTEDRLSVRRNQENHTLIDGDYEQPVDLLPGYRYPWPFSVHIDVLTFDSVR